MKITDAKVFIGGPGKNYVTLKIMDIWQFFYRGAYFRRGPIAMAAFGAIDTALWDIKAKLANMPLYQLFGGKSREGALVYAHATGADLEDLMDSVASYVAQGYKAVRVQCGIPGMPTASYAVPESKSAGRDYITDFSGIVPKTEIWDTERYMRFMPDALMQVRERFGPDLKILHDVHHRLTPREAAAFAKAVEPVGLYWLEDPTPAEDQDALRLIRQHSTTPIAIGEVFNTIWDCNKLIENELIDFIRVAVTYAGGITHVKRIIDLAALHHVRTGFHGAPSHSPISMAAQAHLNAWRGKTDLCADCGGGLEGGQSHGCCGMHECQLPRLSKHLFRSSMLNFAMVSRTSFVCS